MQESLTQESCDVDALDPLSMVTFKTSNGFKGQANIVRLSPQAVTFEVHGPETVLRSSELLSEFEIFAETHPVYTGKALVTNVLNTGTTTVCEATLTDPIPGLNSLQGCTPEKICHNGFRAFLNRWQKFYRVAQEYKVVIADIQSFLVNLRLWLDQLELGLGSRSAGDKSKLEVEIAMGLRSQITAALSNMFERFEAVAQKIEPDLLPAHRSFGQRQLHPFLLCAPFIHRTYAKPLGYAGDYEMMNMIVRNGLEGATLFAKLTNAYLLDQVGPQAVRNRVDFLEAKIVDETCRVTRLGRPATIYNIACGPAREVQNFLSEHPLADQADFHFLDFDAETLQYAGSRMEKIRKARNLQRPVKLVRKSVHQMLRGNGKAASGEEKYDLIYSSGLYDYLNDRVIKALNTYLYDRLRPGGLLVVGNFAPNMPVRNFIEHFLEWFLIYRNANQLAALAPQQASPADCRVAAEPTGTNIFLEVRKPL